MTRPWDEMETRPRQAVGSPPASLAPPAREAAAAFPRLRLASLAFVLALAAILAVAAVLRLPALDRIPPGFQFDEAYNAIDAWRVTQGARDLFFPANGGREPLLSYWQALFFAALGPSLSSLRLASAVASLITPAVVAVAIARLFAHRRDAAWLGLLTAAVMAVSYWHLHFSRYSIRAILVPLFMTLVFWAYYEGTGPRAPRVLPLFAAGAAMAGAVYAHPTGRLIPLALAAYTLWLALVDRRHAWGYLLSFGLTAAVSFALFLPLGVYFLDHQWLFWGHPSDVSIFDPAVHGGSVADALAAQALAVLGMFFVRGDGSDFHNLPGRPVFDPVMAVFFVIGLAAAVVAVGRARGLNRSPYLLAALWGGLGLAPTLFSDAVPNFSRAIGALPVLCLLAALGLLTVTAWLARVAPLPAGGERVSASGLPPWTGGLRGVLALGLPLLVLLVSGAWTARDYFQVWSQQPTLYYSYDADKEDAARLIQGWTATDHVYLMPLWASQSTIAFLTRDNPPASIEMSRGLVLPAADGKDAVYTFPAAQERRSRLLTSWLGNAAERTMPLDRQGNGLLIVYRVPSAARPQFAAERIVWGDVRPTYERDDRFVAAPRLVGWQGDTIRAPGDRLQYLLYWHAPQPLGTDLTVFAHLVDASGKTVLQDDHQPLSTSHPVSMWRPNEIILDYTEFRLPDSLPPGQYSLRVGWYDLATGQRRLLDSGADELTVTTLDVVNGQ